MSACRLLPVVAIMAIVAFTAGAQTVSSVPEAEEYCLGAPLTRIEGIWEFPSDGKTDASPLTVLIRRDGDKGDSYSVIALDCYDASAMPGETVGYVQATANPEVYSFKLFTQRDGLQLSRILPCTATLSGSDNVLTFSLPRLRVRFSPLALLPWMRRIVSVSVDNLSGSAPVGLRRVFPSYDGNGSTWGQPRYL